MHVENIKVINLVINMEDFSCISEVRGEEYMKKVLRDHQERLDMVERVKRRGNDEITIHCNNLITIASAKLYDEIEKSDSQDIRASIVLQNIEEYFELLELAKNNNVARETLEVSKMLNYSLILSVLSHELALRCHSDISFSKSSLMLLKQYKQQIKDTEIEIRNRNINNILDFYLKYFVFYQKFEIISFI